MTRYVLRDGKLVEKDKAVPKAGLTFIPDIAPFETVEGVYIGSRRSLREYEKRHNVKQIGNDWAGDSDMNPKPPGFEDWKRNG